MRRTQTCPRGRAVSPACGGARQNTLLFRSVQHREAFKGLNPMERPWESSPQAAAISTLAMKELKTHRRVPAGFGHPPGPAGDNHLLWGSDKTAQAVQGRGEAATEGPWAMLHAPN